MSLTIQVVSFQNQSPPSSDMSVTINGTNCSIGRSGDNDLTLPDPERIVSHHHATIQFRENTYYIRDESTNGTRLNHAEEPIGRLPVSLSDGDTITIGNYDCLISMQATKAESAPISSSMEGDVNSWRPPVHAPLLQNIELQNIESQNIELQANENTGPSTDTSANIPAEQMSTGTNSLLSKQPSLVDNIIPKDFDFLSPGNTAATHSENPGFEQGPVENQYFRPPEPLPIESTYPENKNPEDKVLQHAVESDSTQSTMERPESSSVCVDNTPAETIVPKPQPEDFSEAEQKLLYAFLVGAELTQVKLPTTEVSAFMLNSGALLRELVKGIKQTLETRTDIKGEFRLNMTILRPLQNNPLKFSIDVDDALMKLIQPPKGYLPPVQAVQEATDDLQAHQMATLEGLRAALNSLIERFNPETLEKSFQSASFAENLLPAMKKAKFWELFKAEYNKVAQDAENDFLHLLGDAFSTAYGQQIDKLKRSRE